MFVFEWKPEKIKIKTNSFFSFSFVPTLSLTCLFPSIVYTVYAHLFGMVMRILRIYPMWIVYCLYEIHYTLYRNDYVPHLFSLPFTLEASDSIVHLTSLFTFVFRTLKYTDSCARACVHTAHARTHGRTEEPKQKKKSKHIDRSLGRAWCSLATDCSFFATSFLFFCYCGVHDWMIQLAWLYRLIQFVCYEAHTRTHIHIHFIWMTWLASEFIRISVSVSVCIIQSAAWHTYHHTQPILFYISNKHMS